MYQAIYIHIPFCQSKCIYCDFPSYPQYFPEYVDAYLQALLYEITISDIQLTECATLFIGGGTPSLLTPTQLEQLLTALYNKGWTFSETSIEINPGTINRDKLLCMRELGFNRLSFGVQSFDNRLLKLLGRIHTAEQALANIRLAQELGFENINLDLMYGLPTQSLAQVQADLKQALALNVPHISAYALKIEPDTRLDELVALGQVQPLAEETADQMYDFIPTFLASKGLLRYEISNYARPDYECLHNQVYWRYRPYKGFGLAACSFTGSCRITNTLDLPAYLSAHQTGQPLPCESEELDTATRRTEYLFMNLRRRCGLNPQEFRQLFNEDIYTIYKEVWDKYLDNGLLQVLANGNLALTAQGAKYSNLIFVDLL